MLSAQVNLKHICISLLIIADWIVRDGVPLLNVAIDKGRVASGDGEVGGGRGEAVKGHCVNQFDC